MNAAVLTEPRDAVMLEECIEAACRSIAPTWPLDRFIAVNPHWGRIDRPFPVAGAELARTVGSTLWMPREFYREAWRSGRIGPEHLAQARNESGELKSVDFLVAALHAEAASQPVLPLLSDCLDASRIDAHEPCWRDSITHQVSQFCAAFFDADQADWRAAPQGSLYPSWRRGILRDHSVALLMDAPGVRRRARQLPGDARQCIEFVLDTLAVDSDATTDLLQIAISRIGGWAAWCAYLRWQARLRGADDDHILELLAVRLAWEYLVDDGERGGNSVWQRWRAGWARAAAEHVAEHDQVLAIWQRAHEIAFQKPLARALAERVRAVDEAPAAVQAVFCIDVRSEVFRRALEEVAPGVRTLGFAGFFGLPVEYTPLGTDATRPQLPGLLVPALSVTDRSGDAALDHALADRRRARLASDRAWQPFQRLPGSAFSLVETLGLGYLSKIARRSWPGAQSNQRAGQPGLTRAQAAHLRPELVLEGDGALTTRIELAARILRAMSLTGRFARLVMLAGHGSQSANNPHAAGLDCGACCGQTGEVNARALAALLNDPAVREGLALQGIEVPRTTHFVPALHNTTTDDVVLFDLDRVPGSHVREVDELRRALVQAGDRARAERSAALGLSRMADRPRVLAQALRKRANDWAQTRPEWGLANNAAFIAAPRARTRGVDLGGRCFLHEYDWQADRDGSVLELIMTAPMVVAHWINMQYYSSTVDNQRYGSGNKVLHNVVGGRIGVFEGNGGDLRIGLPLQSVHDGRRWMHTPLRLSVFVEAPRAAIESVIAKHGLVRQLLDNRWLHLFRIGERGVEAYAEGRWQPWAAPDEQPAP